MDKERLIAQFEYRSFLWHRELKHFKRENCDPIHWLLLNSEVTRGMKQYDKKLIYNDFNENNYFLVPIDFEIRSSKRIWIDSWRVTGLTMTR